jgi:cell division protease FtsH
MKLILFSTWICGVLAFQTPVPPVPSSSQSISLSEFYRHLDEHRIQKVSISPNMEDAAIVETGESMIRHVQLNPVIVPHITETLLRDRVEVEILQPNGIVTALQSVLRLAFYAPLALITLSMARAASTMQSQMMQRSSMSSSSDETTVFQQNTTFADWAGSPEVLQECSEVVSFLKDTEAYTAMGASLPKGILLEGLPGTGKTLLARAIAGEAGTGFISVAGSEFVQMFVGLGAMRVRQIFAEARKNKPCILFIDEIDAIGRKRSNAASMGGNDEREQTLNQLLSEMDGFAGNEGVVVIAATNRRDVLDDALLRPGRFDRLINVPLPDLPSRLRILQTHARNKPLDLGDAQWEEVADQTDGFSGADLRNLLNEAAILSVRQNVSTISLPIIVDSVEKLLVGIRKEVDTRSDTQRLRVALHEAGHALVCQAFPDCFQLKKVSIQETYSGAGGYTLYDLKPDARQLPTRDVLKKRLRVLLGGRAAESLIYGIDHVSTGASEDLRQASELCRSMIETYGLGNALHNIVRPSSSPISDQLATSIDDEIMTLVREAYQDAFRILRDNRELLQTMANHLLALRILQMEDLKKYILG